MDIKAASIVYAYKRYGDTEPLKEAIRTENQAILKNEDIKKILIGFIDTKPVKHGRRDKENDEKEDKIYQYAAYYHVYKNLPLTSNRNKSGSVIEETQKRLVKDGINYSEDTIKKYLKENKAKFNRYLEKWRDLKAFEEGINRQEILKRAAFYQEVKQIRLSNKKNENRVTDIISEDLNYDHETVKNIIKEGKKTNNFKFLCKYFKGL